MREETTEKQQTIGLPRCLKELDMFGESIPSFNLRGKTKVKSFTGGSVSLVIIYIVILFAALKLMHLFSKHNPSIN